MSTTTRALANPTLWNTVPISVPRRKGGEKIHNLHVESCRPVPASTISLTPPAKVIPNPTERTSTPTSTSTSISTLSLSLLLLVLALLILILLLLLLILWLLLLWLLLTLIAT